MNNFASRDDKPGRLRQLASVGLLLTLVGLGLAACGGNDEPSKSVAELPASSADPSTAPSADKGNPVAYAQCMRANGLTDFPDPDQNGSIKLGGGGRSGGLDPDSAQFKAAAEKCKQYMGTGIDPNKGTQQTDPWPADKKLAYAKCMRENGLPSFPDPDQEGRFPQLGSGQKIDPESPEFKKADKACASYKPQGDVGGAPGGGA